MQEYSETPSQYRLDTLLAEGVMHGDALGSASSAGPRFHRPVLHVPPYADQRAYSHINPDRYVDWFLPHARAMLDASLHLKNLPSILEVQPFPILLGSTTN